MTDLLGRKRYRLDRRLGVGAMGTVHLGHDTILDRVVAVKVLAEHLAADEAFRERFVREARIAARLCHPNIVQVFDAGDDADGRPFIVMEYVDGETVADRLARHAGFTGDELVGLLTELSAGLARAHGEGVVHRDVKPHNILLRRDGVAKLTDFGIARAATEAGLTEIGTVLGTAPYMAPEQAAGAEVGPAADIYALGALARHAASGPFPPALESLVDAALAADPAARPSAEELHHRLTAMTDLPTEFAPTEIRSPAAAAPPEPTTVAPPRDAPVKPSGSWPAIAAVTVIVLLIVAVRLAGSHSGTATPPPPNPVAVTTTPAQTAHDFADWIRAHAN